MWVKTDLNFFKLRKPNSDDAKAIFRNYVLAWVSIAVLVVIGTIWIWLAAEMQTIMAHTFAWELLLRTFGSSFSLECPEGLATSTEEQWPPLVANCVPKSHSIPCIPIIVLMILTISILFSVVSLLPVSTSTLQASAYGVRVALTWHVCFLFVSLIVVSYFYNEDIGSLRHVMQSALKASKVEVTEMWNATQITSSCCGIDSYKDWNFIDLGVGTGQYPASCCLDNVVECTNETVWKQGCLHKEEVTLEIFGTINFFILCFQCLVNIYLCYLIQGLESTQNEIAARQANDEIELEAPLLQP